MIVVRLAGTRGPAPLRLVAMAFFAWSAYRVWAHLPEPDLTPVLDLVLFLIVCKLFQRSANRDYLQIYVLAFLMVLAGRPSRRASCSRWPSRPTWSSPPGP